MPSSSNGKTHDKQRGDDRGASVTTVEVEELLEEGARDVPPPDWLLAWMWVSKQRAAGRLPN
jgi:hypothetical protein